MPLYLDHNAGSPLRPEAFDAMRPLLERGVANPSSPHQAGQAARAALEEARDLVAELLGGRARDWIFTSGATEACNIGLRGAVAGRALLVGATEHPAVMETAKALEKSGTTLEILPVLETGVVDLSALDAALARHPGALVALMGAHNETGVLQPLDAVRLKVAKAKSLLFSDLSQFIGKVPVNVYDLQLDLAAMSGTKFGGPQGSGLLYKRQGLALTPTVTGGEQEQNLRPGTENVPAAVGLAAALKVALKNLSSQARAWEEGVEALAQGLQKLYPGLVWHGRSAPRVPNTLFVSLPGQDRDTLLMRLDQAGLRISAGSACASGAHTLSPALSAMGASPEAQKTALRFSFGPGQGPAEALAVLKIFQTL